MLIIKTDTYTFSAKDTEGFAFTNYMMDTYELGGAKVESHNYGDGLIHLSISYTLETDEIKDFNDWKIEKTKIRED